MMQTFELAGRLRDARPSAVTPDWPATSAQRPLVTTVPERFGAIDVLVNADTAPSEPTETEPNSASQSRSTVTATPSGWSAMASMESAKRPIRMMPVK